VEADGSGGLQIPKEICQLDFAPKILW
jgi:hypothetical protein